MKAPQNPFIDSCDYGADIICTVSVVCVIVAKCYPGEHYITKKASLAHKK